MSDLGENTNLENTCTNDKKQRSKQKIQGVISYLLTVLITFSVCLVLTKFVGQFIFISGDSMEPTYSSGDIVFVKKFANEFQRNDIVICKVNQIGSDTKKELIIKRIIGMPGETIQIKQGKVYINGNVLADDPINTYILDGAEAEDPIVLKENEYFLLGDNRNESFDSRYPAIGPVHSSNIEGVVVFDISF